MKQNRLTLSILLVIFIVMIALLAVQSAQSNVIEIPRSNENLINNDVDLNSGLLFPNIRASDVVAVNILDPVLNSQVTVAKSEDNIWQVISEDGQPTNQEYAESLAVTFERIPYISQISLPLEEVSNQYGLNETDGLIVATVILTEERKETFVVGNPVSTDDRTRGFYTVVDGRDEVYIVPPEPIMYLVQYLEAFENTQKLDN